MVEDWTRLVLKSDNIDSLYYSFEELSILVHYKGGSIWKYIGVKPDFIKAYEGELTAQAVLEALRHNNIVGIRIK